MTDSDYGTAFTRAEFKEFVEKNGTRHLTTVLYHAASNGFALRALQTVKRSLLKQTAGDIDTRLSWFTFNYRSTPSEVTRKWFTSGLYGLNLISSNLTFKPECRRGNAIWKHATIHTPKQSHSKKRVNTRIPHESQWKRVTVRECQGQVVQLILPDERSSSLSWSPRPV